KSLWFNSHLKIVRSGRRTISNYPALMKEVASNKAVTAVAPFVLGQVMIETEPQDGSNPLAAAPWVRGIDPKYETNLSILSTNIIGEFDLHGDSVLVGSDLAHNLGLH